MAKSYDSKKIEKKWQNYWYDNHVFDVKEDPSKPKFYGLVEFPYPSGAGLHVGHVRAFSSLEIVSRKKRLEGYNVLFPMGYDAFGLPTENYAIQTKTHPRIVTDRNIKHFTEQLKSLGFSFSWDRVVDTTDPNYYKWTQWIFLQLFKKGLAYKSTTLVNFCPSCNVVLANEESQQGVCDRCGTSVVQKEKDVWFLKIRDYAERLLDGLNHVNFPERIKVEQQNWIGKSTGAIVTFPLEIEDKKLSVDVFTTRPDTIYGATFMVLAPEHPIIKDNIEAFNNSEEIIKYQESALSKKEFDRVQVNKDKTGILVEGLMAINPITKKTIPVFTADYVMMDYGTGAIMGVPAHDQRDWDFAKKFNIPIIEVIKGNVDVNKEPYCAKEGEGILVNSPLINGLTVPKAIEKIINEMQKLKVGYPKVDYKMKDWAFNRQRYWGEPIPIINCPKCGQVPMDEKDLPLELPYLEDFSPSDEALSPLAKCTDWVNTTCPKCGGKATRETDTMPQWAGSSWYFLRYQSPNDDKHVVDPEAYKYWGQVDWYNGGMEHVTRHLIYSRFWNQFLYDIGVVTNEEPYLRRSMQGLILGADGEKMSKSLGNVVNPDDVINEFGADVLRTFILFIGDYEKPAPWSEDGIKGSDRFIKRLWNLQDYLVDDCDTSDVNLDVVIKKVSDDIESCKFNTAIAAIMETVNAFYSRGKVTKDEYLTVCKLVYPIAPHITSEIYNILTGEYIEQSSWPKFDPKNLIEDSIEIPVQILGKVRGKVNIKTDSTEEEVVEKVKELGLLDGKKIIKIIYVKNRIINFIAK